MRREDVEDLLEHAKRYGDLPGYATDMIPELCRRWLAVEEAPVRNVVGQQWDDVFAREGNVVWCSDLHPGQHVRIVPEQGEGDRG